MARSPLLCARRGVGIRSGFAQLGKFTHGYFRKIVVDAFLEVGQYVPGRISTLAGRARVRKGTEAVRHVPV
jgi:hypothetical protein